MICLPFSCACQFSTGNISQTETENTHSQGMWVALIQNRHVYVFLLNISPDISVTGWLVQFFMRQILASNEGDHCFIQ